VLTFFIIPVTYAIFDNKIIKRKAKKASKQN